MINEYNCMVSMAIHQLLGVKGRYSLCCGNIFGLGTATCPLDLLHFLNPVTVLEDLGFQTHHCLLQAYAKYDSRLEKEQVSPGPSSPWLKLLGEAQGRREDGGGNYPLSCLFR